MKAIMDIFATLSELSLTLEHYIPIITPVFNNEGKFLNFYKTIYETPISVERKSVSDFSKGIRNLHFINNDDHFFNIIP